MPYTGPEARVTRPNGGKKHLQRPEGRLHHFDLGLEIDLYLPDARGVLLPDFTADRLRSGSLIMGLTGAGDGGTDRERVP